MLFYISVEYFSRSSPYIPCFLYLHYFLLCKIKSCEQSRQAFLKFLLYSFHRLTFNVAATTKTSLLLPYSCLSQLLAFSASSRIPLSCPPNQTPSISAMSSPLLLAPPHYTAQLFNPFPLIIVFHFFHILNHCAFTHFLFKLAWLALIGCRY